LAALVLSETYSVGKQQPQKQAPRQPEQHMTGLLAQAQHAKLPPQTLLSDAATDNGITPPAVAMLSSATASPGCVVAAECSGPADGPAEPHRLVRQSSQYGHPLHRQFYPHDRHRRSSYDNSNWDDFIETVSQSAHSFSDGRWTSELTAQGVQSRMSHSMSRPTSSCLQDTPSRTSFCRNQAELKVLMAQLRLIRAKQARLPSASPRDLFGHIKRSSSRADLAHASSLYTAQPGTAGDAHQQCLLELHALPDAHSAMPLQELHRLDSSALEELICPSATLTCAAQPWSNDTTCRGPCICWQQPNHGKPGSAAGGC